MRFVSEEAFRAYADAVARALGSCADPAILEQLRRLHPYMQAGDLYAEAAEQAAAELVEGMYLTVAHAQDAAADAFCAEGLGMSVPPARRHTVDAAPIIGSAMRAVSALEGDDAAAAFALRVASAVSDEALGLANGRMDEACRAPMREDGRIRYAYVPSSRRACGICCMFASRGFDFGPKARPKLHDRCRCLLVPGIEGETSVGGYDRDACAEGFSRLVARDSRGEILRNAEGRPVFKADLTFDLVERKVVERERDRGRLPGRGFLSRFGKRREVVIEGASAPMPALDFALIDVASGEHFGLLESPESPMEAARKVNPSGDANNCQSTIVAWELRMRGANAVAKPFGELPEDFDDRCSGALNWTSCFDVLTFEEVDLSGAVDPREGIRSHAKRYEPDSRFLAMVFIRNLTEESDASRLYHIIGGARNPDGSVDLIDVQGGCVAEDFIFRNAGKCPCHIMRIDDKGITEAALTCCRDGGLL